MLKVAMPDLSGTRPAALRYGVAAGLVIAGVFLRLALTPWLGNRAPFSLFTLEIVFSAAYGGTGPGILATVLSVIAVSFLLTPEFSLKVLEAEDGLQLGLYFVIGIAVSLLGGALRRTIDELRKTEAQLNIQTGELTRTNAELERFASSVSHDLKEPLRTIGTFTELLAERAAGDEESARAAEFIQSGIQRMEALIEDVLEYSRAKSAVNVSLTEMDLGSAVNEAVTALKSAITGSSAVVTTGAMPKVVGRSEWIERVFENLISNAIKYRGAARPEIRISARTEGKECICSVSDNGIGFDMQYSERIFEPFTRLHPSEAIPGSGLGLATVKRLIERQNGRIWAESAVGAGTTFYISLPLAGSRESELKG